MGFHLPWTNHPPLTFECGIYARFQAPELLRESPEPLPSLRTSTETDIFAVGMTFWELVSGKPPFDGANVYLIASDVSAGKRPSIDEVNGHVQFLPLIKKSWSQDPRERPSADAICEEMSLMNKAANIHGNSPGSAPQAASVLRQPSVSVDVKANVFIRSHPSIAGRRC